MTPNLVMEHRRSPFNAMAATLTPAGISQFKLERLLELRAVIDAMRSERGAVPAEPVEDLLTR